MRNLKHTIVAVIAVAMISAMGTAQITSEAKLKEERISRITSNAASNTITIAEKEAEAGTALVFETSDTEGIPADAEMIDIETEEDIAKKSFLSVAYTKLASGTLPVYAAPSDESTVIDQAQQMTEVEILESTEGWYKIAYGDNKTGYVVSAFITEDKAEAEEAAMNYTHYRKAHIDSGSAVNVRSAADESSSVITQLDDDTEIIDLGGEGN